MARILSVEDDPELQHLIGLTLRNAGYEVHYAFTGKEGYEKVMGLNPDLVILDMMLPVMSGLEVIKKLKAHESSREIPIIVTTAYYDSAALVENSVRTIGAVDYLKKPVRMEELVRAVRRAVMDQKLRTPVIQTSLRKGVIRADPKYRTVWVHDRLAATLTRTRFALLKTLLESNGQVRRDTLMKRVWGEDGTETNLEKTIQRLREDLGSEGVRIQTTAEGYELIG